MCLVTHRVNQDRILTAKLVREEKHLRLHLSSILIVLLTITPIFNQSGSNPQMKPLSVAGNYVCLNMEDRR